VVPAGGAPLVSGLQFPNASPYAQVPAGTYNLNVNAAGTDTTAISVPNATVASGGVYSAFAVGTAAAGNLDVILAQDNAGTEPLPDTGGISPTWLAAGLATMGVMLFAASRGAVMRFATSGRKTNYPAALGYQPVDQAEKGRE
jgi:hypothetical protein